MKNCCKNCKHIIVHGGVGMCFCEESPYWHWERWSYEVCDHHELEIGCLDVDDFDK